MKEVSMLGIYHQNYANVWDCDDLMALVSAVCYAAAKVIGVFHRELENQMESM